jgi:hypothetical protein
MGWASAAGRIEGAPRPGEEELAKGPGVDKAELASTRKAQDGMSVKREGFARLRCEELAAHAQVRYEHLPVIPPEQEVLPMATDRAEGAAAQNAEQAGIVTPDSPGAGHRELQQLAPEVEARHTPPNRLDLGQLGHV